MQTAGVNNGFSKTRINVWGVSPPRPPTGALLSHVQSLDFAERIDSYFAKFNMWRLEESK